MSIVCKSWLCAARNGDGSVTAHLWVLTSNAGVHTGPDPLPIGYLDGFGTPETKQSSTALGTLGGSVFPVRYDFGDTTEFQLKVRRVSVSEEEAGLCPREVVAGSAVVEYVPPEETPCLDDVFPAASKLLFGESSIAQWVLMGRMSSTCSGAVEAGPGAMGDLVFCPVKFGSAHEFLVALDAAGRQQPDSSTRPDAFSRMVFPLKMSDAQEKKYKEYKEDLDRFHAAVAEREKDGPFNFGMSGGTGLSAADSYRLCTAQECAVRANKDEFEDSRKKLDFKKAFPATNAAFDHKGYRWISYRRGKMQACQEKDGERGIPKAGGVLKDGKKDVKSLHQFFCVAEALWASV